MCAHAHSGVVDCNIISPLSRELEVNETLFYVRFCIIKALFYCELRVLDTTHCTPTRECSQEFKNNEEHFEMPNIYCSFQSGGT